VLAADLGASGGRALAERLADAVAGAASLHGAPLSASIGIAACPSDGSDLAALEARADEALFAARAAGVRIV
jgi:GGDEF domain-containing protein